MSFDSELIDALPALRARALSLARDRNRAEDLAQETIAKALQYKDSYKVGTNIKAWLGFICRNIFLSERRRAWRQTELSDESAVRIKGPDSPHHRLALKEVLAMLDYLPSDQAEALLVIAEGLSYEEAAEALNTTAGTIKSRVSRARSAIDAFFSEG